MVLVLVLNTCYGVVLNPQKAFKLDILKVHKNLVVHVKLADDIYLYKDKFKIDINSPISLSLVDKIKFPRTHLEHGREIFDGEFELKIPLEELKKRLKKGKFKVKIAWQGCSKQGICYQPMSLEKEFDLGSGKQISNQDSVASLFTSKGIFWVLVSFFGFGLLLSLTPCILPMIPILSSIIVSNSKDKMTTKKGFMLSLIYVLSMSVAYAIAGVLAGVFGANIQSLLQNPYVIFTFSGIFVLLALSMFGFYDLELPKSLQNKINEKSNIQKGRGMLGVAIMGFLSALIVGPCVAAPLAGALIYIGQSGDALLGGFALFVMSFGMGVPLLLIGLSAGKLLPRPGIWMDRVKMIFGFVLLGIAIWMLERVIDGQILVLLWAIWFIFASIYMGVFDACKSGLERFFRALAFLVLLYGVLLFVGFFIGNASVFSPLKGLHLNKIEELKLRDNFLQIKSIDGLKKQIKDAKKPILLDFRAKWCASCKELEEITFLDKKVQEKMGAFTLLQVDVSKNSDEDKKMLKMFKLFGPPGIVFFKNGVELKNFQVVGYKNPAEFLGILQGVLDE